jgi:hypothetical protein
MEEKKEKSPKTEKKQNSHKAGLGTRILLRIVTIVLIALIVLGGGYFGLRRFTAVKTENKLALVDRQLSYCQELVTAKYRYSDIITLKKASGFAKSYSIIKYTGLVRAGLADITDVSYSVSLDGKTITLSIPKAEVLGNEIVSQSVFDEKQSVFVPISTQEIFDEIDRAKDQALEDMIAEGILEDARTYAVRIITQFMLALGFEEVKIR